MSAPTSLSSQSPWPGLRSFAEDDRAFFFGRERETSELLALVQRSPVVVLYGQSGLGKTSLLQAGLFPALRDSSLLPFLVRLDHSETAPELAEQVKAALIAALDALHVTGPRPTASETLWEYFHRRDLDLWGPRNRLLLPVVVLDQFEETFTLGQRSEVAARRVAAFADELEALLEHRAPEAVRSRLERNPESALQYDLRREAVKLVITLREDFLAHLDTWRGRMPSLLPSRFRLERMTGAQALDVVQRAGRDLVDTRVASDIVDFVSRSQRRTQIAALEQRRVEPALLSVVLDELNRRRIERRQPRITADLLTGEREGIIQAFYDRAFDDVDPRVRDWIEDHLLTSSGYRDRAALEDARKIGVPDSAFDRLVDRRVLHREERDGVVWLELTHDLLTDPATNSRTRRDQRRQAEEAKQRESEIAKRLKRTTQLAAVFAVLFVAALAALVFAGRMSKRAADMQAQAGLERDKAQQAEAAAKSMAAMAQNAEALARTEAALAAASRDTTLGIADRQANLLIDNIRDLRIRTPVVLNFIKSTDESFGSLTTKNRPSDAEVESYASFLVRASEALYQIGHISEGLTFATRGIGLLDERGLRGTPILESIRANALYARAQGALLTNRLAEARADFLAAQTHAAAAAKDKSLEAGVAADMRRVRAQAELGLGEIEARRLAPAAAAVHFERVLAMAPAGRDVEGLFWRVAAARQLGQLLPDGAAAERWYAQAGTDLQTLASMLPDSLRVARVAAELNYSRGRTADNLGRSWQAANFLQQAANASDTLVNYDPDNLDWKLSAIRTSRGQAMLHRIRQQSAQTVQVLEQGATLAAELVKAEPEWRAARYMHGAILWELGDYHRTRPGTGQASGPNHDEAMRLMQQAQREFQSIKGRSGGDLEAQRALALAVGGLARVHYDTRRYDDAIRLFREAIDALGPAERLKQVDDRVPQNKAYYLRLMGFAHEVNKNWTGATEAFTRAIATLTPIAERTRLAPDFNTLADTVADYGDMLVLAGRHDAAAAQFELAWKTVSRSLAIRATDAATAHTATRVRIAQSELAARANNPAAAFDHVRSAAVLVRNALQESPGDASLRADVASLRQEASSIRAGLAASQLPADRRQSLQAGTDQFLAEFDLERFVTWIRTPIMPGAWRNLTGEQLEGAVEMASEALGAPRARFSAARALTLAFRPVVAVEANATVPGGFDYRQLIEVGVHLDDGTQGLLALVTTKPLAARGGIGASRRGLPFVVLEGTSDVVHQMNADAAPLLETPEQAMSYFRFFMGMLNGDLGPFAVVERPEDLHWEAGAPADLRARVARDLMPVRMAKQTDRSWLADSTVVYAGALFRTRIRMMPSGAMEMLEDDSLATDLPIRVDVVTGGIRSDAGLAELRARRADLLKRSVDRGPADRKTLEELVDLSVKLNRWRDAAGAKRRLVSLHEIESKQGEGSAVNLANEYLGLSWYQLLARNYADALISSQTGKQYDAGYALFLDTNRAHALLFLGRTKEAEALYREHIGKLIRPPDDTRTWQQVILDDFDQLEAAGVKHAEFARIRKILR